MAGNSREDLSRQLTESGLMTAADAERAVDSLPDDCDPATELVSRKMLTDYQASVLGSGELRTLVLGNYVVQDRLGVGGMGVVFLARHRRMKRVVALKVLSAALTGDDEALHRFQREVELLSRLQHPNIATAYDADEADGVHFLVMEYVNGWDLRSLVLRDGALPIEKAVNCIQQAARGLAYAHRQGIIHRDVKPSNLLLDSAGTIKILDLGLARIIASRPSDGEDITETEITATGTVMGTASYMAPEQGLNATAADERSDIYSLGCTFYFAVTGNPPVTGETTMQKLMAHQTQEFRPIRELRPDAPDELCRIIQRMTAKAPEDRFQTMEQVAAALASLEVEVGAAPADAKASLDLNRHAGASTAGRRRTPWLFNRWPALLAGVLLIAAVLIVVAMHHRDEADKRRGRLQTTQDPASQTGAEADVKTPLKEFADIAADFQWWDFVAFAGDETTAVCGGGYYGNDDAEYPLIQWRLADGTAERELQGPTSWVWCGDVSRDRRYVLAGTGPSPAIQNGRRPGGAGSNVFVWDLQSGDIVSKFTGHGDTVRAAAFLSDGERAVSGGYDGTLRLWATATGEELHAFENLSGEVLSLATSPDGRWIASGHWNAVDLWNMERLAWDRQFDVKKSLALAFSHDARYLAIGGDDEGVRIVDLDADLDASDIVGELIGHTGRVIHLAWLPDGRLVSCSDDDRSIRLWDVTTREQIPWFQEGDRAVKSFALSRDGRRLLASCADGTVQLWDLPPVPEVGGNGEQRSTVPPQSN